MRVFPGKVNGVRRLSPRMGSTVRWHPKDKQMEAEALLLVCPSSLVCLLLMSSCVLLLLPPFITDIRLSFLALKTRDL